MIKRRFKKKFIGSCLYAPKKTILSDNLPEKVKDYIYKLNPNLFTSARTKKDTKL